MLHYDVITLENESLAGLAYDDSKVRLGRQTSVDLLTELTVLFWMYVALNSSKHF